MWLACRLKFVPIMNKSSHVDAHVWAMIIINMHVGALIGYECLCWESTQINSAVVHEICTPG